MTHKNSIEEYSERLNNKHMILNINAKSVESERRNISDHGFDNDTINKESPDMLRTNQRIKNIKNNISQKGIIKKESKNLSNPIFEKELNIIVNPAQGGRRKSKLLSKKEVFSLKNMSIDKQDKIRPIIVEKKIFIKIRQLINQIIDSYYFIGFMMMATIYVLFISDIKSAFINKDADFILNITQTICFALFSLEVILASLVQKDYIFSFFFWLDLISTISLLQDIDFIFDDIVEAFNTDNPESSNNSKDATQSIAKAASAGRVTRILRIVRIIRLIRIVKLYKTATQTRHAMAKKKKEKLNKLEKIKNQNNVSNNVSNVINNASNNAIINNKNYFLNPINNNCVSANVKGALDILDKNKDYDKFVMEYQQLNNKFNSFNMVKNNNNLNKKYNDKDIILNNINISREVDIDIYRHHVVNKIKISNNNSPLDNNKMQNVDSNEIIKLERGVEKISKKIQFNDPMGKIINK